MNNKDDMIRRDWLAYWLLIAGIVTVDPMIP